MFKQKYKTIHTKSGKKKKKNVNENGKLFTCEQSKKKAYYETIHTKREKKAV